VVSKLLTAGLAAFWAIMSFLLWRAEFGQGRSMVAELPLATVIDRVLTASDPSTLRLRHHRQELGILRWLPSVTDATPSLDPNAPEGMVEHVGGYRLDVDLNLNGETPDRRWRLLAQVELTTNRTWREIQVRLVQRPAAWELVAREGEEKVTIRYEDGRNPRFEHQFSARDLEQLPAQFSGFLALLPGGLDPAQLPWAKGSAQAPVWTARHDTLQIGGHRVRVFCVTTRIFQRFEISAYFSRSGELLQVTLPDHYSLNSDSLFVPAPASKP
jgi:hypothetical protein